MISRRIYILFLSLCVLCSVAYAQSSVRYSVVGEVYGSNGPLPDATVAVRGLSDSAYVAGCVTDKSGKFVVGLKCTGSFSVQFSYLGYVAKVKTIRLTTDKPVLDMGRVVLKENTLMLGETVITGEAPPVTMNNDTTQFNVASLRMREGSVLNDLVRMLPGVTVDDDGTIKVNGKAVNSIMVDGKDFFSGNPDMVLQNLPYEIIENIKVYDRKSEAARVTGIDDGVEVNVLDIQVKKDMKRGWFGNVMGGYGTAGRYEAGGMMNRFRDNRNVSVIASSNNTGGQGYDGLDGGGRMASPEKDGGINSVYMVGVNGNIHTEKFDFDSDVSFRHSRRELDTRKSLETYHSEATSSLTRSIDGADARNNMFSANMRMEWRPDSMTNISFSPRFRFVRNETLASGESATYDGNGFAVNRKTSLVDNNRDNMTLGGMFQINRKLGRKGRNILLNVNYNYDDSRGYNDTYTFTSFAENDSIAIVDRRTEDEDDNGSLYVRMMYSEPLWKSAYLQFSYRFGVRRSYSSRMPGSELGNVAWKDSVSNETENIYRENEMRVELRQMGEKVSYSIGGTAIPQYSRTWTFTGMNKGEPVEQVIWNYSPTFDLMFKFSKSRNLHLSYRGHSRAPSVKDMQEIIDVSDPMDMRFGNPSLKPSFTNFGVLSFSNYNAGKQRSLMLRLSGNNVMNGKTSRVQYDMRTGARKTYVENINGNWSVDGNLSFSAALRNRKFNVSTVSSAVFRQIVGFSAVYDGDGSADKSYTHNLNMSEKLSASYRNDFMYLMAGSYVQYSLNRNNLSAEADRFTSDYTVFSSMNFDLPWNMELSSDINYIMRRGYSEGFDGNFVLWNIQLSKSFLKGNRGTFRVKAYDVLQQQTSRRRSIGFNYTLDSETDMVSSYVIFQFVYRINTAPAGSKQRKAAPPPPHHPLPPPV